MDDGDSESIKEPSTYFKICMKNKGYLNRLILNYMCTQKPCHMRIDLKYTHVWFCFRGQRKLEVWYSYVSFYIQFCFVAESSLSFETK